MRADGGSRDNGTAQGAPSHRMVGACAVLTGAAVGYMK